jgi:hypothetical protein
MVIECSDQNGYISIYWFQSAQVGITSLVAYMVISGIWQVLSLSTMTVWLVWTLR